MTPERRGDRRDEQSLIAARERAGDRAGRVTAEAVGEPPFAALGLGEIAADLTAEADQSWKFCFHRCLLNRKAQRKGRKRKHKDAKNPVWLPNAKNYS